MSTLIDDLLRLSRISRQNMEMEQIDLSRMCENIIRNNFEFVPSESIQVSIQEGIFIYCDTKLMRIALENLLDNAIKYSSHESSPEISVGMKQIDGKSVVYISDNGVGFDPKFADKIFKPFQRLHGSDFSGTGIGLATVHRIIERHGGRIWADSAPNQGAWFYFELSGGFVQQNEHGYSVS
jgi:signal transduction histidine kinase